MFNDILYFIVHIGLSLLGIAFIFRAWLFAVRMPPFNPYSQAVIQVTDWAVQPLKKLVSPQRYLDLPSLLAAWLCAVVYLVVSLLLLHQSIVAASQLVGLALAGVLTVIKWGLNTALWLILIQVILSWVNPTAPAMPLLQALTRPIMEPIRRHLPATGAIDFSPLIVLLILQVANMVVQRLSMALGGL